LWSYSQRRGAIFLVEEAVHSTLVGSACKMERERELFK